MLANYLIGLREGLEASLVVGILIAYVVKVDRRELIRPIWAGVGTAVALALAVGATLTFGTRELDEAAQEAITGVLSIIAVALVTWMIFWMARNARALKGELHARMDSAAAVGPWAVAVLAFVAVAREGLETALFVWSAAQAAGSGGAPLLGAALGLGTAVLLGVALYRGALRLNLATFFTWTGAALVLVAAGVLAYGIHELQEAGVLPGEDDLAFDLSSTIPPDAWYAVLVRGVLNLTPAMSVLQVVAWVAYVVPVMWLFLRTVGRRPSPASSGAQPVAPAGRG